MGIQVVVDNPGLGEFSYQGTAATGADPGFGNWARNGADTRLDISVQTANGFDISAYLDSLTSGSFIRLRSGGEDRYYSVVSRVDRGTFYEVVVTLGTSSPAFALNIGDTFSIALEIAPSSTGDVEGTDVKSTGVTDVRYLTSDTTGGSSWEPAGTPAAHDLGGPSHQATSLAALNLKITDATLDTATAPRDPNPHALSHANGQGDEINVTGLSGTLADPQTPTQHGLGSGAFHSATTLTALNALITGANLDDENSPRDPTPHSHTVADVTDAGTAALVDTGVAIGQLPLLVDSDGQPGFPAVDALNLTRTGVRGGSGMGNWTYEGLASGGGVLQGQFRSNLGQPSLVTELTVHEDAMSGNSSSTVWRDLKTGDRLYFTCPSTLSTSGNLNADHTFRLTADANAAGAPTIVLTVVYEGGGVDAFDASLPYSVIILYSRSTGSGDGTIDFQDGTDPTFSSGQLRVTGGGATLTNNGGIAELNITPGATPNFDSSDIVDASDLGTANVTTALNSLNTTVGTKLDSTSPLLPTQAQKDALEGTGIPSTSNRYVTENDARLTDARTPTQHDHLLSELGNHDQNRLVGRVAAGSGVVSALAPATVRTMLNVADGANASGAVGDAHAGGDGTDHAQVTTNQTDIANIQTQLANVPTTIVSATDPGPASFGTLWIQTT